jgi:hypothetical protein
MEKSLVRKTVPVLCLMIAISIISSCGADKTTTSTTTETLVELTPTLVSASSGELGEAADAKSENPSISKTGNLIAFQSEATNLSANDTNGKKDIYLRDISKLTTTLISFDNNGKQHTADATDPDISADGKYVVYELRSDLVTEILIYDTTTTTTESITSAETTPNGNSSSPSISGDGRHVAFVSEATDLVATDTDTNAVADIFLRDTVAGTTKRISVSSSGTEADGECGDPHISSDGDYVVFSSDATNLVSGDTNGKKDIFLHQVSKGTTKRVSLTASGSQTSGTSSSPFVSENGAFVIFTSAATDIVTGDSNGANDVFMYKESDGSVSLLSYKPAVEASTKKEKPSTTGGLADDGRFSTLVLQAETGTKGPTQALAIWRESDNRVININPAAAEGVSFLIPLIVSDMSDDGQFVIIQATNWPLTLRETSIGDVPHIIRINNPLYKAP